MAAQNLANELTAHLASKGLTPKASWMLNFLSSQRSTPPLPALKQTATFRLCLTDITQTIQAQSSNTFPSNILDGTIKERKLAGPVAVQVVDMLDIGSSRWSQAEALLSEQRGETTRGREIIRTVPNEENGEETRPTQSSGPFKVTLQDAAGVCVYGFERESVGVAGMSIGGKMVLRNVTDARGLLDLEPSSVTVVGGKIDELQKKWMEGRLEVLRAGIDSPGGG